MTAAAMAGYKNPAVVVYKIMFHVEQLEVMKIGKLSAAKRIRHLTLLIKHHMTLRKH